MLSSEYCMLPVSCPSLPLAGQWGQTGRCCYPMSNITESFWANILYTIISEWRSRPTESLIVFIPLISESNLCSVVLVFQLYCTSNSPFSVSCYFLSSFTKCPLHFSLLNKWLDVFNFWNSCFSSCLCQRLSVLNVSSKTVSKQFPMYCFVHFR